MKRPAFTLLELLLVLALISAISSLGVAGYKRQYERSRFKSGVVGIQIDLNRTRLLAMRSGQPYIFRFVPGTGFYEIAPLQTLQEAIYRMSDDEDSYGGALGGSLYSDDDLALAMTSGSYDFNGANEFGTERASDDLFSQENVLADLEQAGRAPTNAGLGASASPLGGSLTGVGTPNADASGELGYLSASDGLGTGGEITLDGTGALGGLGVTNDSLETITIRDMNSEERQIGATPNTLAWRVNLDGLVVRKEAEGGVVFTFSRLSESTPSNLKKKREHGAKDAQDAQGAFADSDGEDLGSRLGGSLSSPPAALDETGNAVADDAENDPTRSNLWSEPIIFFPNGRASTVVVGLASDGKYGYYSEIGLRGMTGYARISAITTVPAGARPDESVLTQDQLFRLANPGVENPDATAPEITGGALGGAANTAFDSPGGALGLGENSAATSGDSLSGLDASASSGVTSNYGSTERRPGYSFGDVGTATSGSNAGQGDVGSGALGTSGLGGANTDAQSGGLDLGNIQTTTAGAASPSASATGTNSNDERRRRGAGADE